MSAYQHGEPSVILRRPALVIMFRGLVHGLQAVALEAMRGAHRQQRACYLYAFSGPSDVKELELKVDTGSLLELLNFLTYSFGGGTDVDCPLELSLDRLEQRDWSQVSDVSCLAIASPCLHPMIRVPL